MGRILVVPALLEGIRVTTNQSDGVRSERVEPARSLPFAAMSGWQPSTVKHAVAISDYSPQTAHCLSLALGDQLQLLEQNGAWYRGRGLKKG